MASYSDREEHWKNEPASLSNCWNHRFELEAHVVLWCRVKCTMRSLKKAHYPDPIGIPQLSFHYVEDLNSKEAFIL